MHVFEYKFRLCRMIGAICSKFPVQFHTSVVAGTQFFAVYLAKESKM